MTTPGTDPHDRDEAAPLDDVRGGLDLVLDLQPFPMLVFDCESGRVVRANEAARRVPLDPPEADPAYHATAPGGRRIGAGQFGRHLAAHAGGPEGTEVAWHTPGRVYEFRVYARPLPRLDGQDPMAVLTFLDVTRQKAAEADMRQALEARDEFFSIATHELKDPLFSLQLSIQLLRHTAGKRGEVPEHVLKHLEVSQRQSERLSRLIDNLLDVARIRNRRVQLDAEAFDLADLVREVVGRFRERAEALGMTVAAEIEGPILGYFDRMKLEQVLSNLLSNALKYGAGKPVAVRARPVGDLGVVEVEDRGVGIAPADQPRIFGRFERASQGHKKESLGLGLYIVRALVEAHGGDVTVRSEPGRGTTFTVTLPRNRLGAEAGQGHG